MTNTSPKIDPKNFKADVLSLVEIWLDLMFNKQYEEAGNLCTDIIKDYGSIFRRREFEAKENEYNTMLILLVFIKALEEYVHLCQITQDKSWYKNNKIVEKVWIKLCDCRERFNFSSQNCQGKAIEQVTHSLNRLENFFQETFGIGSYVSPGIIAGKYLCNICNKDCRACSHIAGRIYDGKICFYKPVNPRINHVALVEKPKDPRCRIWSWNIKDHNKDEGIKMNVCILTTFSGV